MSLSSRRLLPRLSFLLVAGLLVPVAGRVAPAKAAVDVVASSSSGSSSSRSSITLTRPAGTAADHVMVAQIASNDDNPGFSAPAGWTVVSDRWITDAVRQAVYVKVAEPSEPASYTWTLTDGRRVAGGITTYAGVDPGNPIDASATSVNTSSSTAVTAPSITTTVADTVLVHLAAINAEGGLTPPAGMTEHWEAASPNGTNTRDVVASASDAPQPTAAPTGVRTATATQAGPSIGTLLALRPAGSPPPPPPPAPPPDTDPVLVGAGDIASCSSSGDERTAALLDGIPGTVFTVGDNVYPDATAAEFANCYNPTWGRHKARTLPAAGNHEYHTPGASGYYGYFGAAAGDPGKGYYHTTRGAWDVIVLNSNCGAVGGCGAGSAQEQWLRSVLAASTARCTVAIWHHPRFSSARNHGSDPTYEPFWQALYEFGADVVLVGHDHVYERFGLQTPTAASDTVFGLRQFTVGTGGRSHYSFGPALPHSQVRNADTFGVLKLTLHADSYDWQFVPEAGKTFTDSGTAACHGAPSTPPPPPPPPPTPGPITPVASSQSGSFSSRSSITLSRPMGTVAGQVMVASIVSNDDNPGFSAPGGWDVVSDRWITDAVRQAVYVKVAGPSEPASYTWTLTDYRRVAGGITTYAGVDPDNPIDASASSVNTSSSTAVTAPSITTTVADTLLVHFAAINAEGAIMPPPGMTERWEAVAFNTSTTRDVLGSSSDAPQPATGVSGPRTATASLPGRSIGTLLALRPAS